LTNVLDAAAARWTNVTDWGSALFSIYREINKLSLRSALPSQFIDLVAHEPELFMDGLALQLGYEAGLEICKRRADPRDVYSIGDFWEVIGAPAVLPPKLAHQTMLWASIRSLAAFEEKGWDHRMEIAGAQALALKVAETHPEEWARALPWLLARAHLLRGFIEATTMLLDRDSEPVRVALQQACFDSSPVVRDRARGIEALRSGFSSPQESLFQQLLSFASHLVDGATAFPHPLEPMSSIWIGNLAVEQILRSTVDAGHRRFIPYFLDQGRIEEEAVTGRLLAELEMAFRDVGVRVDAFGVGSGKVPPKIEFLQKQVPKRGDEETYGCDLALLIQGRVPGALRVESAELVQVKKPEVVRGRTEQGTFRDAWRVDILQLADILEWSQTAAYWLIDPNGEIFATPARLLRAILQEQGKLTQGSAIVPYGAVRSMGIPLRQFLVDLVIGLWIGTTRADTLRFAKGEAGKTRPRHIVEIEVRIGERQG